MSFPVFCRNIFIPTTLPLRTSAPAQSQGGSGKKLGSAHTDWYAVLQCNDQDDTKHIIPGSEGLIPLKDINPTRRFPLVTVLLVGMNIVVFFYQLALGPQTGGSFLLQFALVPARLFHSQIAAADTVPVGITVFTSMFLHAGFLHVAGNMLYLWIFGNNVEDAMGPVRFVLFYFLCGSLASISHAIMNSSSLVPMVGASGAVSGVLGAYLLLYPRARVLTAVLLGFFVRTIEVPAVVVLGFWFLLQFLNVLVSAGAGRGGGVAWYAHIGGFVAGMLLIGLFKRKDVPFGGGRRFRYV